MHIKKVTIKDFRCFEHLEVNLNPDINIFVGNNGSGKSALLDAIASAMFSYIGSIKLIINKNLQTTPFLQTDFPTIRHNIQKSQSEFTVSTTSFSDWKIVYEKKLIYEKEHIEPKISAIIPSEEEDKKNYSELENICRTLKKDPKSELSVIAYYRGNRHLSNISDDLSIGNEPLDRFDALNNALNATANYTDLAKWFFGREYQELRELKKRGDINFVFPDLKQIRNAVSTIIPPAVNVYFLQTTSAQLVMVIEWKMETGEIRELLLSQLSAGYRNMLVLVMDFARRLAQANPEMENPLAAEAILMIDELDLHLHPTWQQTIIPDLRKVFPNTQIIATTHSPEVVTTVQQNQVFILENYQIKECPAPTRGMKSSDVVRYVLGLKDLRPDTEESRILTRLFEVIDNGQLEEAKRLRKELEHWESVDADMTRADMQIRRLERRGIA